jgi:phosphoglycolate phosphatase-like HAD superfamily hydrolase
VFFEVKQIMKIAKKHYIFDLDDTLVDSGSLNTQYFVDVFKGVLDIKSPEVNKYLIGLHSEFRGGSMRPQFEKAVSYYGLDIKIEYLLKKNEEIQLKNAYKVNAFNSVSELITKLKKQKKTITVFSNRQTSSLTSILKHSGLHELLDNIISCSDLGHEKPDPFCLNELVKKYNDTKDSFIYFGDSKTDKEFAESAGIDYLIIDNYINKNNFYKLILQAFM